MKMFDKMLLRAVDDAFSSLGDSAKESVYFHLEYKFHVAREEIPSRIEDFSRGLERIFGQGAQFLEILIMKRVYEEMGQKKGILKIPKGDELKFNEYIRAAGQLYGRVRKS
jgi:hypothetical protein